MFCVRKKRREILIPASKHLPFAFARNFFLDRINQEKNIIANYNFHSQVVSGLPLQHHFLNWVKRNHIFTFCNYPFLLNPIAKINLLHFESKQQMAVQFERNLGQALLGLKTPFLLLNVNRDNLVKETKLFFLKKKKANTKKNTKKKTRKKKISSCLVV